MSNATDVPAPSALHERLEEVFQTVFFDQNLSLTDETTAADIPDWDSVAHINLMLSIEEQFGIRFTDSELGGFANVGELKQCLVRKGWS